MPDILSDDDLSPLAAEYVLGTLDSDERTRANVLLDTDHQFRGMVRVWERRLGELHLMVEPVDPDVKIWERIRGKLKDVALAPVAPPAPPSETKPAGTTEQKLAGIVQEVERLAAPKPDEAKPVEAKTAEPQPPSAEAGTKPAGSEPEPAGSGSKPTEPKPADAAPAEPQSAESKAAEPEPLDPKLAAIEAALAEAKSLESKSLESKSVEPETAESRRPESISRERPGLLIPAPSRDEARAPAKDRAARPARVGRWRAFAVLMTLVAVALGGLIAAWRYAPDRLPPQLRPTAVLRLPATPSAPTKKPAPPESQFDE